MSWITYLEQISTQFIWTLAL